MSSVSFLFLCPIISSPNFKYNILAHIVIHRKQTPFCLSLCSSGQQAPMWLRFPMAQHQWKRVHRAYKQSAQNLFRNTYLLTQAFLSIASLLVQKSYWNFVTLWLPCSVKIVQRIHQLKTDAHNLNCPCNNKDGISNHQPHDYLLNCLLKGQNKVNIKALHHWPLWGEFTDNWWIPHTKGQWKMFPLNDVIMKAHFFVILFSVPLFSGQFQTQYSSINFVDVSAIFFQFPQYEAHSAQFMLLRSPSTNVFEVSNGSAPIKSALGI